MSVARGLAVVGLGELLWDELPGGRRLGGAPANFAAMAARLGVHGILASRLGQDEAGDDARELLRGLPVDARFVQTDSALPTGRVSITLREGQPEYVIHAPAAWDALELTPEWQQLASRADAVCWGSLGQRDARARATITAFVRATRPECMRVFDVNLRQDFATAEAVRGSLELATLLKLNDGELPLLLELAGLGEATGFAGDGGPERDGAFVKDARRLLAGYPQPELVTMTLGGDGSLLVTRDEVVRNHGTSVTVVDTVGAGDAFTAALVTHRLRGASLAVQSEAANRWGAWVASQAGAIPPLDDRTRVAMERAIVDAAG